MRALWTLLLEHFLADMFNKHNNEEQSALLAEMLMTTASAVTTVAGMMSYESSAALKTPSGLTKRVVNKLCLLPLMISVQSHASNKGSMLGHAADRNS